MNEKKKCNKLVCILSVLGILAVIGGIIYAIYRFMTPDYLEEFEDDFEDDFDDDFFEEETEDSKSEDITE